MEHSHMAQKSTRHHPEPKQKTNKEIAVFGKPTDFLSYFCFSFTVFYNAQSVKHSKQT
jgi:hypothetical protein